MLQLQKLKLYGFCNFFLKRFLTPLLSVQTNKNKNGKFQ